MSHRGNTAYYADAFIELYKIATMLEIWDKKREADILSAIMQNDFDKLKELSVKKADLLSLHSEIKSALKDAKCPDGVVYAVDEIFNAPMSKVGVRISRKRLAAKEDKTTKETTVERLERTVGDRPKEFTRVTETAKIKPKPPMPFRRNLDGGEALAKPETSGEYFNKLNMSSMPTEEAPKNGYEGLNELYSRRPNEDVNKKRFKQTSQGHKEEGVLIVPAYMNNGIMYRGDIVHLILENIAKRNTTGLSVYVGAVPLDKEQLNNIGDVAMRLVMKDNDMVAKKLSGVLFTSLLKKASELGEEALSNLKTAYNNNTFESHGLVDRQVIYPVRPESNVMQYAHEDKVISIDSRSLSGVIMRADVKNKVLTRMSLQRPLGKTSTDLKIYYVKMIEAGGVYKAAKFKKAVKELYDVDCGDLDDKILDMAHGKSVTLEEIEGALFPTQEHQQKLDTDAATSNPTGTVNDKPVRLSYVDISNLMEKYVNAKRKKAEDRKEDDDTKEELTNILSEGIEGGDPAPADDEIKEFEGMVPEGVEVMEIGGSQPSKDHKNISISVSTDPDSGQIKVYLNGSLNKEFPSTEEALAWAGKVSQIFNNILDSSSDVVADFKFSDISKLATVYNGYVSHITKLATFSNNLKVILDLFDDIA